MKTLLILALATVFTCNVAHATSVCNSGLYTSVSALNSGGGCVVGDILFSNFSNLPANVGVEFLGGGNASTLDLVDDSIGNTGIESFTGFTYAATVEVAGLDLTEVVAGMLDAMGISSAQLLKVLDGGAIVGIDVATATDVGGTITDDPINSLVATSSTSVGVNDNFILTSGDIGDLSNQYLVTSASTTPEPVTFLLIGGGLIGVFFAGIKRA